MCTSFPYTEEPHSATGALALYSHHFLYCHSLCTHNFSTIRTILIWNTQFLIKRKKRTKEAKGPPSRVRNQCLHLNAACLSLPVLDPLSLLGSGRWCILQHYFACIQLCKAVTKIYIFMYEKKNYSYKRKVATQFAIRQITVNNLQLGFEFF